MLFTVSVASPTFSPSISSSTRDRDRIFGERPVAPLRSCIRPTKDEDRGMYERKEDLAREKRRADEKGKEETEIEKGRGRWRLQGYTRPERNPVRSRASECPPKVPTVPARGEAPALSHATPRYALTLYEQH